MKKHQITKDYVGLLKDIKARIQEAQYAALKAVNTELIALYWDIGRMIAQRQRGETWGKSIVQKLAADLQKEFPGIKGFSPSNLWRMRIFYGNYSRKEKLAPLVREISWSHNLLILEKCEDDLEREFYLRMSRKFGWSKNVLGQKIESKVYEKTFLSQTNFVKALPVPIRDQARIAAKDEYTFDFLELGEEHTERELERALLARMDRFLREMGGVLAFVGSQYRLEVDDREYFVDLLLYHRHLRCLVAVELKAGEFMPEYVGKMQFYLAVLNDSVKVKRENPAIGIIVCKSKNKTIVEYALKESRKPIGIATYKMTAHLPEKLRKELPGPDQISKLIEKIH